MGLEFISAGAWWAGLGALAAVLFVLQRLRVRYREVPVVTTLFWREAIFESRARVLTQRFRHPWAYLLIVAIAALLWLALAHPEPESPSTGETVVLIDGGATRELDDSEWTAAALAAIEGVPREARRVIFCGDRPHTLLRPGEHARVMRERIDLLPQVSGPASVEAVLSDLALGAGEGTRAALLIGAELSQEFAEWLGDRVRLEQISLTGSASGNLGITGLGLAAGSSWDRWDAWIRVERSARSDQPIDPTVAIELDGAAWQGATESQVTDDVWTATVRDLPAAGGTLTVRLDDAMGRSFDDSAALTLAPRPPLRVQIGDSVGEVVRAVLTADPGVQIVAAGQPAEVAVLAETDPPRADLPTLSWAPRDALDHAFVVVDPVPEAVELATVVDALALSQIDATSLADETGEVIDLGITTGPIRGLRIWDELITDRYDFVRSRAFPLVIARGLRWLAGVTPTLAYAHAGVPLPGAVARITDPDDRVLEVANSAFTPPRAGQYRIDGQPLAVSGLDRGETVGADEPAEVPEAELRAASLDLASWVVLAALVLVSFEWWAYRSGRIP